MYALDAKTGKIVWEFFLVPRAEGDVTRGPQCASPLNMSTWQNATGAAGVCVSRRVPCHRCMGDFRPSDVIAASPVMTAWAT
jgi:hypothetical protein